jgi:hypothetical protein
MKIYNKIILKSINKVLNEGLSSWVAKEYTKSPPDVKASIERGTELGNKYGGKIKAGLGIAAAAGVGAFAMHKIRQRKRMMCQQRCAQMPDPMARQNCLSSCR